MTSQHAGLTDTGLVREHNEDALLVRPPLFAVADGLGGHQAGEVASATAVRTLLQYAPRRADARALARAVKQANEAVMDAAENGRGHAGMGTTLTAAMVDGLRVVVAHVGDSRAYLMRDEGLTRVSLDHSLVADMVRQGSLTEDEARIHPNRSVITRALGSDPNLTVDTFEVTGNPGDMLLLCSDGLSGMLTDPEIERILRTSSDPDEAVRRLVDSANAAGGHDNVTAVVVRLDHAESRDGAPGFERPVSLWSLVAALLLLTVVVGCLGLYGYARSRAFVIAEDSGSVVIYQGLQGSIGSVRMRWFVQRVPVDLDALPPTTVVRLREGIAAKSVVAAERLADQYREQAENTKTDPDQPPGVITTSVPAP